MNNIAYERVIMQVNAVQDYIESLDSMPMSLQKSLVNDLDLIVADLDYYGNVIHMYNKPTIKGVDEFCDEYDKSITKAKAKLDDMFKENDDG